MKSFILTIACLLTFTCFSRAQNGVIDTHPTAVIYVIDYSTGQEVPATFDAAILFKNAFIDLVSNTMAAKMQGAVITPGRKTFVITQMSPETNGNAYQLVLQSRFLNQTNIIYTFIYSADDNQLSFYNQQMRNYSLIPIQGYNVANLTNCFNYGKFNAPQPVNNAPAIPSADLSSMDTTPVDVNVSASTTPPEMPEYQQPECPVDGYLWQPGYWAFNQDNGYYWVPGVWVAPPAPELLWTPPYWGYDGGFYVFHNGYWGNTIGFYGGINYGYGYGGVGFVGGGWQGGRFRYNTAVVRVNVTVVHNVYIDNTVIVRNSPSRVSFNGRGGIIAAPNQREMAAARERHMNATSEQIMNQRAARTDRNQFASANGGRPQTVAAPRPMQPRPSAGGINMGNRPDAGRPGGNNNQNSNPGMPGNNAGQRPGGNNIQNSNPGVQGNNAGQRPGGNNNQNSNPGVQGNNAGARPGGNNIQGATQGNNVPGRPNTYSTPGSTPAPNSGQPNTSNNPGVRQNPTIPANPNAGAARSNTGGAPAGAPSVPRAPEARPNGGNTGTPNNQQRQGASGAQPANNRPVPQRVAPPVVKKEAPPAKPAN